MFGVASGIIDKSDLLALKTMGVSEVYCGFIDKKIAKTYPPSLNILNRRGEGANFTSITSLAKAAKKAHALSMPVYVTFNGLYTPEQYPWLTKTINKVSALTGISGIIVNDIALLLMLKKQKYKKRIVLSVGASVLNSHAVSFFKKLNVARVILERQMSHAEMVSVIKKHPDMEFEVFAFAGSCFFIDGFCAFFHNYNNHTTQVNAKGCHRLKEMILHKNVSGADYFNDNYIRTCGLCALYKLKKFQKRIVLKVVNRQTGADSPVKVLTQALKFLKSSKTETEYKKYCKALFKTALGFNCEGKKCYF
ncbi:MAG: U32 family peptidase [Elusimicrobia bacterium]|nr:U32 family peptidase [Elusimicrobiota bacterium]